ncbi:MAG: hypothetical protein HWE24_14785 [Oceanospirillaceae bacterium]|nr:hypothetical protein [Oceanospirillaceae bacterium]
MRKLSFITAVAGLLVTGAVQAETQLLELNGATSFDLVGGTDYTFEIQLEQPYSEITRACLTIETNDENLPSFPSPGSLMVTERSESAPIEASIMVAMMVSIGYEVIDPVTGNVEIYEPSISDPEVCLGMTQQSLEDGYATIDIRLNGNDLKIDSLRLEVEGIPSNVLLSLVNRSDTMFFPPEGGDVVYDFSVGNYFDLFERNVYRVWSVVTMPDGSVYPDKLPAGFALNRGEVREFVGKKFKIPHWFPGGSYTLTWYVADNSDGTIHQKSFTFFKAIELNR